MPVKKPAIEQITNPAIKRLSQVASINRLSGISDKDSYAEIKAILNSTLQRLMKQSIIYTEYARRETVYSSDVEYALDDISYLLREIIGYTQEINKLSEEDFERYRKHIDKALEELVNLFLLCSK